MALTCVVAGCGPSEQQREGQRILGAIDRLRDSTDADRLPLLEAVERTKAEGQLAERARSDCASAYRALHESVVLEASVRRRLGNPPPPSRPSPGAAPSEPPPDAASTPGPDAASTPPAASSSPDVSSAAPPTATGGEPRPAPKKAATLEAEAILADLAEAERKLDRARELMPRCESSVASLRQLVRGAGR